MTYYMTKQERLDARRSLHTLELKVIHSTTQSERCGANCDPDGDYSAMCNRCKEALAKGALIWGTVRNQLRLDLQEIENEYVS